PRLWWFYTYLGPLPSARILQKARQSCKPLKTLPYYWAMYCGAPAASVHELLVAHETEPLDPQPLRHGQHLGHVVVLDAPVRAQMDFRLIGLVGRGIQVAGERRIVHRRTVPKDGAVEVHFHLDRRPQLLLGLGIRSRHVQLDRVGHR